MALFGEGFRTPILNFESSIFNWNAMSTRILCLGNELLADDALGFAVARQLRRVLPPRIGIVETSESGFYLIDYVLNCSHLIVVDSIVSGSSPPGTIYLLREQDLQLPRGESPHYIGLFETLETGRKLNLPVPEEVTIVAVEAADCFLIGGKMHPAVEAAVPRVTDLVARILQGGPRGCDPSLPAPSLGYPRRSPR